MKMYWSAASIILALSGCVGPSLRLRSAPSLSVRFPQPPRVPEAVSQQSSTAQQAGHPRVISARALGNIRQQTILLILDGDPSLRGAMMDMLPTALISNRFTRVLLPPALESVTGTVERGNQGERTTLSGPADRLLPMRANTPIDAVLRVELQRAANVVQHTTRYAIPDDALERYAMELNRYQATLARIRQQLDASADYPREAEQQIAAYQARGGRFEDEESRQRAEEARSFVMLHAQLSEQLRNALAAPLPGAEAVQRGAASRVATSEERSAGMRLRALYTDLREGETFWFDEVSASNSDERTALNQALATLIQDLGGTAAPPITPAP